MRVGPRGPHGWSSSTQVAAWLRAPPSAAAAGQGVLDRRKPACVLHWRPSRRAMRAATGERSGLRGDRELVSGECVASQSRAWSGEYFLGAPIHRPGHRRDHA
jgi:hypothetical protein